MGINYRKKKLWIKGKKCTNAEDIKGNKMFYREKEYIEMSKIFKKENEYIYLFDEPFIEREELYFKIETINLKKPYTNIADMMNGEGFNFELNQNILKKMDFGWECGSLNRIALFKPAPVVMNIKKMEN